MQEERVKWREIIPVAFVAWLGALVEWVDFYTYAMVAKIIGQHYFPSHDPVASLLGAYAGLAIGFLFRPLGALLFGKIGDQFGRKMAFLSAVLLMLVGTLGMVPADSLFYYWTNTLNLPLFWELYSATTTRQQ
ncbi:MAG TPA: hypothetical protein EYP08_00470, partial [Pyrodictiaceae archaeon]|nr:hypothetical protein [Pyrodictiaceae archaeon]